MGSYAPDFDWFLVNLIVTLLNIAGPGNDMAKKYRKLEQLVSRIESSLAPVGAVVKSPDRIRDKTTGRPREVDVSIRYKVGSVEILITIECRDRRKTDDVTWIEQIATKQKNIGAAHTIAVSSKGFSDEAIKAAMALGISTRKLSEIQGPDIIEAVGKLEVSQVRSTVEIGRIGISYFGTYDTLPELDGASLEEWKSKGWGAAIFTDSRSGNRLSIVDLVGLTHARNQIPANSSDAIRVQIPPKTAAVISTDPLTALLKGMKTGGMTQRVVSLGFGQDSITVNTNQGRLSVRQVDFELKLKDSSSQPIPIVRTASYSGGGNPIVIAEREIDIGLDKTRLIITQVKE